MSTAPAILFQIAAVLNVCANGVHSPCSRPQVASVRKHVAFHKALSFNRLLHGRLGNLRTSESLPFMGFRGSRVRIPPSRLG